MSATETATVRLGFLGTGWIGLSRLQAVAEAGTAQIVAVADPSAEARDQALAVAPNAQAHTDLDGLLAAGLDGLVIATPSALHAEQAITALDRGIAVFCQKPLARTQSETDEVLSAAARCGRPLGVDFSYRDTRAGERLRQELLDAPPDRLHALELVFHNAYGPDKAWFTDRRLSGGGCVVDLASHLIDLILWCTGAETAEVTAATLRRQGRPLSSDPHEVEDFAWAEFVLPGGLHCRLACSWFLPAGQDCRIEVTAYGTEEALALHNVEGSFYDFALERFSGTSRQVLVSPPDAWGGRTLNRWVDRLRAGEAFDSQEAKHLRAGAGLIDRIYAEGAACAS